jgi:hypothetical protein
MANSYFFGVSMTPGAGSLTMLALFAVLHDRKI